MKSDVKRYKLDPSKARDFTLDSSIITIQGKEGGNMSHDFIVKDNKVYLECPERSVFWAIREMKDGQVVSASSYSRAMYYINDDQILRRLDTEDDNIKIVEMGDFIKDHLYADDFMVLSVDTGIGCWLKDKNNVYHEVCDVTHNLTIVHLRAAGGENIIRVPIHDVHKNYVNASIVADFTHTRIGDNVFSIINDYEEVCDIDREHEAGLAIETGNLEWYTHDGFRIGEVSVYPILFNDFHQARAHISEVFMRRDKELKA